MAELRTGAQIREQTKDGTGIETKTQAHGNVSKNQLKTKHESRVHHALNQGDFFSNN